MEKILHSQKSQEQKNDVCHMQNIRLGDFIDLKLDNDDENNY